MARPKSYINYVHHKSKGIKVVAHCPVTCGLPTRMTEAGFARACKKARGSAADDGDNFGGHYNAIAAAARQKLNICAQCQGKMRPNGLEIIDLETYDQEKQRKQEVVSMVRKATKCEGCGKDKSVSMCSGEMLCSSCAALAGAVSIRPEIVARMLAKRGKPEQFVSLLTHQMGPGWLMQTVQAHLPEQVAVKVENEVLDQVAKVIGYTGETAEGLIEAVRELWDELTMERVDIGSRNQAWAQLAEVIGCPAQPERVLALVQDLWGKAVQCDADRQRIAAIREALGVTDPSYNLVDAIAEMAQGFDKYSDQVTRLKHQQSMLADQLSGSEIALSALEGEQLLVSQALEQVAEALDLDGVLLSDVPGHIKALKAAAGYYTDKVQQVAAPVASSSVDSILLDLALGAMTGAVSGVGADQLIQLRKVAA